MTSSPSVLLALLVLLTPAPAAPAALAVDADCAQYRTTHTLVRNDVLAKLDASDQNLPKAEAALRQAQADLQAMKAAADTLQEQKKLLQEHIAVLERIIKSQPPKAFDLESAWEVVDAPVGFLTGAGMCVGIAWGLQKVSP